MESRMNRYILAGVSAFLLLQLTLVDADDPFEPASKRPSTSTIMKHIKAGLLKDVLSGTASQEDVNLIHEYARALSRNKPPKGEKSSWRGLTRELIAATRDVVRSGDEKSLARLKAAADCKACHTPHKIYPPEPAE